MVTTVIFLGAAVTWLAYSNGANDNFKGVATLLGSGTTDYREAIAWATTVPLAALLSGAIMISAILAT